MRLLNSGDKPPEGAYVIVLFETYERPGYDPHDASEWVPMHKVHWSKDKASWESKVKDCALNKIPYFAFQLGKVAEVSIHININ